MKLSTGFKIKDQRTTSHLYGYIMKLPDIGSSRTHVYHYNHWKISKKTIYKNRKENV